MLVSTKAIVLSKIRYKDHDLIVKCYTKDFGISTYLIKNVLKTKKGKFKPAYFQPLSILDIEVDYKNNRSLQYFKDVKLHFNYSTLHNNVIKSAIIMFLSEILSTTLNEEEQNLALYNFLETTFIWFDQNGFNANFHLIFLIKFTKYLGFYPGLPQKEDKYFNLEEGKFQLIKTGRHCVSRDNLNLLKQLLGIKFDESKLLVINSNQKREFLNMILLYFKLHLDGFKQPKSVIILNQVFN